MKFLEISTGISVRKEEIVAVTRENGNGCRVFTEKQSYDSTFPYETILSILEMEQIEEKVSSSIGREQAPFLQFWRG